MRSNRTKGVLALLLATLVWGTTFTAQRNAAGYLEAFTFNAIRNLIAAAVMTPLLIVRNKGRKTHGTGLSPQTKRTLLAGFLCGTALTVASFFQQYGIEIYPAGVAAAGRAAFLTATYVVMVALIAIVRGKRPHPMVIGAAVVCVAGMYLLCFAQGWSGLYLGDLMEILCAISFAVQILAVEHYADTPGLQLAVMQFLFCGLWSLVGALLFDHPTREGLIGALPAILFSALFSSCIGYTMQIYGQKRVEAPVASILMSFESVFAAISGWILLRERMSAAQMTGCVLMFGALLLTQLPGLWSMRKGRKPEAEE
ncbi:MAG: DMT family transporter [Lachnospiraceae bacterium]|nr:DMT family transporter [Lachnospiraceae bacterium]